MTNWHDDDGRVFTPGAELNITRNSDQPLSKYLQYLLITRNSEKDQTAFSVPL